MSRHNVVLTFFIIYVNVENIAFMKYLLTIKIKIDIIKLLEMYFKQKCKA